MSVAVPVASGSPGAGTLRRVLVVLTGAAMLLPGVSPAAALLVGVALAVTLGNPWPSQTRKLSHHVLTASVVGLGAGMNLAVVGRVGLHGLAYTALGITTALAIGTWLGRRLRVAPDTSLLVTCGTAICGGSAIAAVAPTIRAKDQDVSMALAAVFVLNGVALLLFPPIGRALHLSQESFGLWCALAIHDTSSVVGAAAQYGEQALGVATAAKLARALWIVPVTFGVSMLRARAARGTGEATEAAKPRRPWFIAGFLALSALVTLVPSLAGAGHVVSAVAHRVLSVPLFLIGLGLSRPALRALGWRPLAMAIGLWIVLGSASLLAIASGWISG